MFPAQYADNMLHGWNVQVTHLLTWQLLRQPCSLALALHKGPLPPLLLLHELKTLCKLWQQKLTFQPFPWLRAKQMQPHGAWKP